jgi:excisionase family DNA binding protein
LIFLVFSHHLRYLPVFNKPAGAEMPPIEPWFSVEEIARHLGVSKETIYRWLEKGKIPSRRIGKLWKFKPSKVDQWVDSGSAASIGDSPKIRDANV